MYCYLSTVKCLSGFNIDPGRPINIIVYVPIGMNVSLKTVTGSFASTKHGLCNTLYPKHIKKAVNVIVHGGDDMFTRNKLSLGEAFTPTSF